MIHIAIPRTGYAMGISTTRIIPAALTGASSVGSLPKYSKLSAIIAMTAIMAGNISTARGASNEASMIFGFDSIPFLVHNSYNKWKLSMILPYIMGYFPLIEIF
jgi:hypothetical protein